MQLQCRGSQARNARGGSVLLFSRGSHTAVYVAQERPHAVNTSVHGRPSSWTSVVAQPAVQSHYLMRAGFLRTPPGAIPPAPAPFTTAAVLLPSCVLRLLAVGRDAVTSDLGLERAGVAFSAGSGKIPATAEQTNVPWIYAIGDVLENRQVGTNAI